MTTEAAASRKRPAGLGRGLSALLGEVERETPTDPSVRAPGMQMMAITALRSNPHQPRRTFDDDAIEELSRSIASRGLIQPILVRPQGDGYQIVAGERRWRAAQRAHLTEVPVIVRRFDEGETLEVGLVENVQRRDLNAIEEAEAYHRLMTDYGHSQDALGKLVHKSRSHIANLLRLLDLPTVVREQLSSGALSMGHARALVSAPDPARLAREVVDRGLSVRETEKLAQSAKPPRKPRATAAPKLAAATPDDDLAILERQLGDLLGLEVTIVHGADGGTVTLGYGSLEELDMICQRLSGEPI